MHSQIVLFQTLRISLLFCNKVTSLLCRILKIGFAPNMLSKLNKVVIIITIIIIIITAQTKNILSARKCDVVEQYY